MPILQFKKNQIHSLSLPPIMLVFGQLFCKILLAQKTKLKIAHILLFYEFLYQKVSLLKCLRISKPCYYWWDLCVCLENLTLLCSRKFPYYLFLYLFIDMVTLFQISACQTIISPCPQALSKLGLFYHLPCSDFHPNRLCFIHAITF